MPHNAAHQIRRRIEKYEHPELIEQLCLDGIKIKLFTPIIRNIIEACRNLEYLTINDCCLESLDNFPLLPNIIGLELSDNKLTGNSLQYLAKLPQLAFLTIDNNNFSDIDDLKLFTTFSELQILEVRGNPIAQQHNYRQLIFDILPQLDTVDCQDRDGNTINNDDFSQYMTNRERSKTDLFDFDNDEDNQCSEKKEEFVETAVEYADNLLLKSQGTTDRILSPAYVAPYYCFNRNNRGNFNLHLLSIRTGLSDSDSDQREDLIGNFKKFQKRQ